jgi:hypothetical protein
MKYSTPTPAIAPLCVRGDKNIYTPATRQAAQLWRVELSVRALLWWPTWEGYATSSQAATACALAWFADLHGPLAVDVLGVMQKGV